MSHVSAQIEAFYDPAHDVQRLRAHEVGRTPTPVVRQWLELQRSRLWPTPTRPLRILDPSAGSGVFGMVARELYPDAYVVAVEPREEEWPHLHRHYDHTFPCAFEEAFAALAAGEPFDIIATNPPFSRMRPSDDEGQARLDGPWLDGLRLLLRDSSSVLSLLLRTDPFWRTPDDADWFYERHADGRWLRLPQRESKIPGRIAFYGGSGTAPETHSWFTWGKNRSSNSVWTAEMLPRLPAEALRWRVPPGTEYLTDGECPAGGGDHPQDAAGGFCSFHADARPDSSERRAGDHGGGAGESSPPGTAPVEHLEEAGHA